jgi:RHS repeat-associated protein
MPQGLGRYGIEDAENPDMGSGVGYIPNTKFEWYLKNHLGSTMLVYGTQADANPAHSDIGTTLAAYDYRAFGEMVELLPPPTGKVTENFTGKERDDEIALNYFGARYLDPMLGMWISVDPARQFSSPYLYAGNGYNPVNGVDPDGNEVDVGTSIAMEKIIEPTQQAVFESSLDMGLDLMIASAAFDIGVLSIVATAAVGPEIIAAGAAKAGEMYNVGRTMFATGFSKTIGFAKEFMSCPQCVIGMVGTASKTFPIIEPLKIGSVKVFDGLKIGPVNIFSGLEALGGFISGPGPYVGKAEAAGVLMNVFKEIIKNNDLKLNIVPQNKD